LARVLNFIYTGASLLAGLLMLSTAVLTLIQIVGRAMGLLISTGISFAGYCMVASIFLALPWTLRSGGHIRVDLFTQNLSSKARRRNEVWCLSVGALAVGFLSYSTIGMAWRSYTFGRLSTGLMPIPLWIPQLFMALGAVLMTVAFLEQLYLVSRGYRPSYWSLEDE
jgi:TRAP-type C4-dicarboxylate transport system permease small subunit